jgi:hypothetical protein
MEVAERKGKVPLLRPYLCFARQSLLEALPRLLSRPGFERSIRQWKQRVVPQGYLADIYDGALWRQILDTYGVCFMDDDHSIALIISMDWFGPYRRSPYSIGVIYAVVANLPPDQRLRRENMICIGARSPSSCAAFAFRLHSRLVLHIHWDPSHPKAWPRLLLRNYAWRQGGASQRRTVPAAHRQGVAATVCGRENVNI